MNITADTNVLVRSAVRDDFRQAEAADRLLFEAELVAVTAVSLCEFVWVLRSAYKFKAADAAWAIEKLISSPNVVCEHAAVRAGLATLRDGCDFADGVIAFQGRAMLGDSFTSFDRKAVSVLRKQGYPATLLT